MGTIKLILFITIAISLTVIFGAAMAIVCVDAKKKNSAYNQEEGIKIFNTQMKTVDFMSLINTFSSYLMIEQEINLKTYINNDLLRLSSESDMLLIERCINAYPIVACKYVGDFRYVLDRNAVIKKYEDYQKNTGMDDYVIPLFETEMVHKYRDLFNFSTRFQQLKVCENMIRSQAIGLNFNESEQFMDDLNRALSFAKNV